MELQEQLKVVAIYDGWNFNPELPSENGQWVRGSEVIYHLNYDNDYNLLIPVAKKVISELSKVDKSVSISLMDIIDAHVWDTIDKLFNSTVNAIIFLNSLKEKV